MSFQLPTRAYNVLKPFVQVALPATGTLYAALAAIWGLPGEVQVVGTISAVTLFLGVVLGISTKNYYASDRPYDGVINISQQDNSLIHQLEINTPPENLAGQNSVNFKVNRVDDTSSFDDFHGSS